MRVRLAVFAWYGRFRLCMPVLVLLVSVSLAGCQTTTSVTADKTAPPVSTLTPPVSTLRVIAGTQRPATKPTTREDIDNAILNPSWMRARLEERLSTTPILVKIGQHSYCILENYLGGRISVSRRAANEPLNFFLYLPDYRGYDRELHNQVEEDRRARTKNVRSKSISVTVYPEGYSNSDAQFIMIDAQERFNRVKQDGSISTKATLFLYGLTGYVSTPGKVDTESIVWIGKGSHGRLMYIICSTDTPVGTCHAGYHHIYSHYWLDYSFSRSKLANWREIDDNVNRRLTSWRVSGVAPANCK